MFLIPFVQLGLSCKEKGEVELSPESSDSSLSVPPLTCHSWVKLVLEATWRNMNNPLVFPSPPSDPLAIFTGVLTGVTGLGWLGAGSSFSQGLSHPADPKSSSLFPF